MKQTDLLKLVNFGSRHMIACSEVCVILMSIVTDVKPLQFHLDEDKNDRSKNHFAVINNGVEFTTIDDDRCAHLNDYRQNLEVSYIILHNEKCIQ